MATSDLTVQILQEIRDELRASRTEQEAFRHEARAFQRDATERFEVIETTLRDLAQQMVMLARGVKSALEARGESSNRLDDIERRVERLEQKVS